MCFETRQLAIEPKRQSWEDLGWYEEKEETEKLLFG
jgi:hypothetical protein